MISSDSDIATVIAPSVNVTTELSEVDVTREQPEPQPSTSKNVSLVDFLKEISPQPKTKSVRMRKRKTEVATVLTSTPNKQMIEKRREEETNKKNKVAKKVELKCLAADKKGKGKSKQIKKKSSVESSSDTDEEAFCIVCVEPFSNSKSREKWIACVQCKNWAHVDCTPGISSVYICHNCNSDDSD